MKNKTTKILIIASIVVLWVVYTSLTGPRSIPAIDGPIDPSADPIQIEGIQEIETRPIKDGEVTITKVADYTIAGKVCGSQKYSLPWQALVAPIDLCMSWGKVATEKTKSYLKFSQDMRWYHFRIDRGAPLSVGYVASHSANMHLVAADKNIKKAIAKIGKGDIVQLEGYLIKIKGTYKGHEVWWNSSLSRTDDGNGACEVMYVYKIQNGDRVYTTIESE